MSDRWGEAVMKSDRRTRLLGLFGYITHTFFFFRQKSWWSARLQWASWIGLPMCLTGAVVGVWRYGLSPRFRHKRHPVAFALYRMDEVASLRRLDLWRVHHHLGLQRPGLPGRHPWYSRDPGLAAADRQRALVRFRVKAPSSISVRSPSVSLEMAAATAARSSLRRSSSSCSSGMSRP